MQKLLYQPLERVRDVEAVGSNSAIPTKKTVYPFGRTVFYLLTQKSHGSNFSFLCASLKTPDSMLFLLFIIGQLLFE